MSPVFCDYCDVYLTHDSMSVRKAHNSGRNHLRNVVDYYQRILLPSFLIILFSSTD
jgi:U1 small nuclear ribonucleoprotein C